MIVLIKTPEQNNFTIRNLIGSYDEVFEQIKGLVGGYVEQIRLNSEISILCNEDGKLLGLPYNCTICGCDFVGTVIIIGTDKDRFCDIDLDTVGIYKALKDM